MCWIVFFIIFEFDDCFVYIGFLKVFMVWFRWWFDVGVGLIVMYGIGFRRSFYVGVGIVVIFVVWFMLLGLG